MGLHGVRPMAYTGSLRPFSAGLVNEQYMMRFLARMQDSNRHTINLPSLPAGAMLQQRVEAGSSWEDQGPLNR